MSEEPEIAAERLSQTLERIALFCHQPKITIGEITSQLHLKSHMLISLIFAVPFLLPIPLPGLSTVFGAVILLAAIQIFFKMDLWLPEFIAQHEAPREILDKIFHKLASLLKKTERFVRPRYQFFAKHSALVRVCGFALAILAMLLALPMPPGFNAPPAFAIIVLSVGSLEDDGLLVIFGWVLTILNVLLFATFFTLGFEGLKMLFHL